jgi:hypothetical protein
MDNVVETKKMTFDFSFLEEVDRLFVETVLGELRPPDLTISPDGKPYLYRWHVVPRNLRANVYLHIQVASDPERPLHDHPWDNVSVIVAGGYTEHLQRLPWPGGYVQHCTRDPGAVVYRQAEQPHRLELPRGTPYTISMFSTGPVTRDWGFWEEERGVKKWRSHEDCIEYSGDGKTTWKKGAIV